MLLAGCLVSYSASALAQQRPQDPSVSPMVPRRPEPDPVSDRMLSSQARVREIERQQKMILDSDRLVLLCRQLEGNLKTHGAPNADDLRALLEIEKLARGVKDRMRQ
jgi:hypothetical protein